MIFPIKFIKIGRIKSPIQQYHPVKMSNILLYSLSQPCIQATVEKRPSKSIKSPYCADIQLQEENLQTIAHAPSLGCSGLVEAGSTVFCEKRQGDTSKTTHAIHGVEVYGGVRIGVNPIFANKIVQAILQKGFLEEWKDVTHIQPEAKIEDSRIDFCVTRANGTKAWVEVKNVPLAAYVNVPTKDYRGICVVEDQNKIHQKIAVFPDGFRKKKEDMISPRAAKHLECLKRRVIAGDEAYCVYLTQRADVKEFQPSMCDPQYRYAFLKARANGVQIRCYSVEWDENFQHVSFVKSVPVVVSSSNP